MKWEPVLALIALLFLGVWLVVGTADDDDAFELRPGARTTQIRIGTLRGVVEVVDDAEGRQTFRLLFPGQPSAPAVLDRKAAERVLGRDVVESLAEGHRNALFRLFNITRWSNLVWVLIGLGGQAAFFLRMLVQWIASEKHARSVVPDVFWWLSLTGGIALFAYFAWRRDIVGVLGQTTGVVVYVRNLRLIHKAKVRAARSARGDQGG